MPDEKERGKLSWFKWTVDDAKMLQEVFTEQQVGVFFLAVMKAVETGELDPDSVPPEMQLSYRMFCQKVFAAISAYTNKCEMNARNGAKGGRAKAENARKNSDISEPVSPFKPPTKTEFMRMAKHIRKEYELNLSDYRIDQLFDDLADSGWNYRGAPLTAKKQLEAIVFATFLAESEHDYDYSTAARLFLEKGYKELDAETISNIILAYDDDRGAWQLVKPRGPWYSTIEEVVDAYLSDYESDGD